MVTISMLGRPCGFFLCLLSNHCIVGEWAWGNIWDMSFFYVFILPLILDSRYRGLSLHSNPYPPKV